MNNNRALMIEVYNRNRAIRKSGEQCKCPSCVKLFIKNSYQQCFCSGQCKDYYWNKINPKRHRDGYYREYNLSRPHRIERLYDRDIYIGDNESESFAQITLDPSCYEEEEIRFMY